MEPSSETLSTDVHTGKHFKDQVSRNQFTSIVCLFNKVFFPEITGSV